MKYRAVVKESNGWWIGWLLDLPGVNAQERTKEELMESLRIGAEDMLATEVPFEPQSTLQKSVKPTGRAMCDEVLWRICSRSWRSRTSENAGERDLPSRFGHSR